MTRRAVSIKLNLKFEHERSSLYFAQMRNPKIKLKISNCLISHPTGDHPKGGNSPNKIIKFPMPKIKNILHLEFG
ncbi:MAG: hypothetical protein CO002_04425 [Candidatus Portnoybacteria bacterium CG_4_8_14_3_um_filter_44_10]|uniref:Uncharacterized protein n=5 Tax=Candidatus Portnoyibacteriota TaxID=1817913 RepID=A0A2H0KPE2_9BACT|nr:MAG: hypothetical protein COV85_04365 [Candidatus Portnoybacteria bacterium CG11_big_fil_rev_8_21_14_0_20_44_10]PIS17083.1 MAG: hypothetical protein COT61_00460 [Candidatus Portnoybacteria bacterium CG09_land_8_20_14_0_10_44_13]PIW75008.1 MAG: hypothetical protein CO002_04425 [Candidatus Portnoybacteria bacterium CG_4_8_14_3_um_filter_44_10]PIZ70154.1 MAG: hypothetical protein COY11_03105 [Candidatus Portnoybacteria bacterium CG_4_10_14_0_2_um_filter_44_20]PJA62756.1 MAG: hypothetical protei